VARGSTEPPFLIALGYGPTDAGIRLALVGKGLTFDSGGLSLKTANGMEAMKGDMGGAAAVIGGMMAISRLAPAGIHVMGLVGATENMPSGTAMRPGDVLTAMNGKTIEVLNTDAEGRLVLADLLTFAEKQGATHVVDFATLTGSAIAALGTTVTLATGKPEDWVETVVNAARCGSERAWPMPLYPEYRRAMDSDVADIKNVSSGRAAGALTASAFLSEFVDSVPWAHMDIAGPSWNSESRPHLAKGGTGAGVGTIVSLVLEMSEGQ
jgi:leucyl aminopeptidase